MTERSPYAPPAANTETPEPATSRTPLILLAVIAVFAYLTGIGDVVMKANPYYSYYYLSTMIIYAVLAVAWYQADAVRLGRPRSKVMVIAIIMILALSIPVYLFRSRGAARGALATALFILFLVGCVSLNVLGELTIAGINGL